MTPSPDQALFDSPAVVALRADLALALRAAAHHGLGEGVCNHFSVALPGRADLFLLNPRGLMWSEVQAADIVLVDAEGRKLAGRHAIEPTAMFIHAAVHRIAGKACVLHSHVPNATALTLTEDRGLDTTLSQTANGCSPSRSSRRCGARCVNPSTGSGQAPDLPHRIAHRPHQLRLIG